MLKDGKMAKVEGGKGAESSEWCIKKRSSLLLDCGLAKSLDGKIGFLAWCLVPFLLFHPKKRRKRMPVDPL